MPWYKKLESIVAPTRGIATMSLLIIISVCVVLLFIKNDVARAAAIAYIVSP